ncbi:DUF2382 domain-containing protein [Nonomuraea sp. NPDC049309]|uniref:DUF2382 domain-containing protein n=1 Tax=Nonomuraea sp. NPDC049309 TaxID=3364350 RepID=UPI0037181FFF
MNTEIRNLLDCHVVGSDGQPIGKVGQVYLNDRSGEPEWVTVRTGFFGMKQTFVPLQDARRSGEELRVPFDKEMIKGAPSIDVDGRLSLDEEADLYSYYGMQPADVPRQRTADSPEGMAAGGQGLLGRPAATDTDRPGGLEDSDRLIGDTPDRTDKPGFMSGGTGEPGLASGRADETGFTSDEPGFTAGRADEPGFASGRADEPGFMPGGPVTGMRSDMPGETTGMRDDMSGDLRDDVPGERARGFAGETGGGFAEDRDIDMTRSEEQLHIGKESRESGRVRLHKYVETEDVQETVPLSHEEIVIEREDIRDAGLSGPYEIGAEDREMILHEERPVIGKETVPVERIHVYKRDVQSEEVVEGQIRKERLEIDEEGASRDDRGFGRGDGFPPSR